VSAQTTQTDLLGNTVREQPPTDPVAAALDHLPPDTSLEAIAGWTQLAKERDTQRVLRWIDRARAEGVILSPEGGR
jgi:hypothetical protein